ncbi:uncharacterized protein LOC133312043 [Gastrolobium bilobum]|uniref:uncharacterized protein LOC133312043 n=1 Tax=Gastrolobium bilobum TaxID=150636 RepID=UPI002AAF57C0|nr:uncharacterized protein LOC133312043 [Gastrolobium bilobum]
MVLAWIHRSISENIAQSILWIDRAYDVWNDLRDRFSQSDIFRVSDIQEDLYKLQQGERSVSEYYTQLKTLWDELENLKPLPLCRSQIMLLDPLPNVNRVFSMVIQQERHLQSDLPTEAITNAGVFVNLANQHNFQRGGNSYGRGRGRSNSYGRGYMHGGKLCTYCGRTNHTVETCFQKHGFPPGFRGRGNSSANNVETSYQILNREAPPQASENQFPFSQEQCQQLMLLLQS